jgi:outer membrane protein
MNAFLKLIALVVCVSFVACSNGEEVKTQPVNDTVVAPSMTVAYVDMDTLQAKYQYYIDGRQEFEKTYNSYQTTMAQKVASCQNQEAEFQKNYQEGKFLSEAEVNNAYAKLVKQRENLERWQEERAKEISEKELAFNKSLEDSIHNFLNDYNKEKNYTLILPRNVVLNTNAELDITAEVVKGLNERYTKEKK